MTAGHSRAGKQDETKVIEIDGLEIEANADTSIPDALLALLALMARDRETIAMVEMPLAAVSVICHALTYLRNNPELEGLLKVEADAAWHVMTYIADDVFPGAQRAFDALDAEFKRAIPARTDD
jgi:hypothetical protein